MSTRADRGDTMRDGLLLALGGLAVRLGTTDAALLYVKPSMRPFLVAAGVVVILLGIDATVRRRPSGEPAIEDGTAHQHQPRVTWLLLVPVLAVVLVPPAPLGTFATKYGVAAGMLGPATDLPTIDDASMWPELPAPVDGAVPLSLVDFMSRAHYDEQQSLEDVRVRLTGFVSDTTGDGFRLTRFTISCCAADARPVHVRVVGTSDTDPATDSWLEVEGTWRLAPTQDPARPPTDPPVLVAQTVTGVAQPAEPYEF